MALLPLLFCFLACSITRLNAQGTAEGCVTCAFADFFKTGLEEWVLPALGTLQFLQPDPAPLDPTIPKNEPDQQWTNNFPENFDQADIQLEIIVDVPGEKCDPNGPKVSVFLAAFTDIFTVFALLTIFVCILVKGLRCGNSSDSLASTSFLRRRGTS